MRSPAIAPRHRPTISRSQAVCGARRSVYLPRDVIEDLERESVRLDRSWSWLIRRAWELARAEIRRSPGNEEIHAKIAGARR